MSNIAPINDINLKIFDEICEERFSKLELETLIIAIVDNLPSDALPHLAEQYHITGNEGWLQAITENEKRNLIKNSIKMHRYKGTKYALVEILKNLNVIGEVKEWFEYGGEPFCFKIQLRIFDRPISEETENKLIALINEYKNVRSKLESIDIYLNSNAKICTFCNTQVNQTITIKPRRIN